MEHLQLHKDKAEPLIPPLLQPTPSLPTACLHPFVDSSLFLIAHIQSTGSSRQPIRDPPTCLHLPLPPGSTTTACLPYHPPSPALGLAGHPLPAGRVVTPEQNQILSPPCFKFSVASSCVQNETRIPHRGTHSTRTADPPTSHRTTLPLGRAAQPLWSPFPSSERPQAHSCLRAFALDVLLTWDAMSPWLGSKTSPGVLTLHK